MARVLPPLPRLEHLRKQAKALLTAFQERNPEAARLVRSHHPRLAGCSLAALWEQPPTLADAYLVLSRDYGFPHWSQLKRFVEQQTSPHRAAWVEAVRGEELPSLHTLLQMDPTLASSHHVELDDPFRMKQFPVATLLYAAAGYPCQTPECWARRSAPAGSLPMVRLLVEAGADVNVHSHHGLPLCWISDSAIGEYLVSQGAELNRWHDNGGSPLAFATWQADPARLQMLLALGADPNRADPRTGESYLHTAAVLSNETALACLQLLLRAGADPNQCCQVDPQRGNYQVRKVWPEMPLVGEAPLHRAALLGSTPVVRLLLQHGADPNLRTTAGETPLDWAGRAGRPAEIRLLLGARAADSERQNRVSEIG